MKRLLILFWSLTAVMSTALASPPLVTHIDSPEAPAGLDGAHIALWQSHGRYFDLNENRWKWQRSRLFGTVEDLYPQAYVLPFLVPMLENAGANVLLPRERDLSTVEVVCDNDGHYSADGYHESHGREKWHTPEDCAGFALRRKTLSHGENPFRDGTVRVVKTVNDERESSVAVWNPEIPTAGEYAVYISYASLPRSATDAWYRVNSLSGAEEFKVNQQMGGGTWVYLGTFPFASGRQETPIVELINLSRDKGSVITADAVKIGGGMGNVARNGEVSGYPRFTEGARYWLQWAGMPDSVYSVTGGLSDYEDDYKSRGLWVNYMAGGSERLPGREGAGIPIDLSFAFHTDAGTAADYEIFGTLPIICTSGGKLGDGSSRRRSLDLATMVTSTLMADIRTQWEPDWTQRKLSDKSYHEAREPEVPAMLLELLSHQNMADMRYGLDPGFRFTVSRAIYKGMLKFLASRDGREYVVQPLPVADFAITGSGQDYMLSWKPVADAAEPTAMPDYYIVYERADNGVFTELAVVDEPYLPVKVDDNRVYSYKVVAANKGGVGFPSEVLSLCNRGSGKPQVLIVNGFTRISGPDEYSAGSRTGGFDYASDQGVAWGHDICYTGEQTETRKWIEWTSDDSPGFGASRADMETVVLAGNTQDYPAIHGAAVAAADHSFISTSLGGFLANSYDGIRIIDLILGKQKEIKTGSGRFGSRFKAIPDTLQWRLSIFADKGGCLFVSGSYVATDFFDNPLSSSEQRERDRRFASKVLGIGWRMGKATTIGCVKEVKSRFPEFSAGKYDFNRDLTADCYAVESPDSFYPVSAAGEAILRYVENDYIAATAYDTGIHRTVTMGFPFETMKGERSRDKLMRQILEFFTAPQHSVPVIRQVPETKTSVSKKTSGKTSVKSTKKSKRKTTSKTKKKKRR